MDRDKALRLLNGGEEDVREWNRRRAARRSALVYGLGRRAADEEIPHLSRANLSGANLSEADLSRADLSRADLSGANLRRADLSLANLREADLSGANLSWAYLRRANLSGADLSGADLSGADLSLANLREAYLRRANLSGCLMVRVDLRGAKLCGCCIFGISAWNIKTDEDTEQINLIVSDYREPILTVDNLKIAQFIYLLLNNEEIREVIDTITSKVVLILGRFTPERKALLDAIREALRRHDYLPVMFDFEKPRCAVIRRPSRRWRGWPASSSLI